MDDNNLDLRITASLDAAEAANSARDLKSAMRELNALAEEVGSENEAAYFKIKQAAADASLKVREMTESTKALAGTPLQATAGSFRLIRENLMTMNFEALSKNITLFAGAMNKLNPNGLSEGFGKLGQSLMTLGKALLTNPIFLIGAAIVFIIEKFDELKEAGGLIGKVFTGIGNAIKAVIHAITAFTDAIGLTDLAAEKRNEKMLKGLEKEKDAINDRYEFEKQIAELTGGNVEALEGKKLSQLKANAKDTINIYTKIKEEKGELSDKETEKYEEALKEYKKIADEEYLYQAGLNKKILDNQKETLKALEQAEINAMTNESAKKKAQLDFDAKYEKDETKNKLQERTNLLKAAEIEELKNAGDNEEKRKEISDRYRGLFKQAEQEFHQLQLAQEKKTINELSEIRQSDAEKAKAVREKAEKEKEAAAKKEADRVKKFIAERDKDRQLDDRLHKESTERKLKEDENADKKRLADEKTLQDKTQALLKDTLKKSEQWVEQNAQTEVQAFSKAQQEKLSIASAGAGALSSLNDLISQSEENRLKKGEKLSIEVQKKQFARHKALGLVGAAINTAKGITAALSEEPPLSFVMAALTAVAGIAQIAAIASKKFDPESGGDGGDSSTPSVSAPGTATAQTLSTNTASGQFFGAGTARAQKANVGTNNRVYVVESDITNTQNRVAVTQTRSTLSGRH